MSEYDNEHESVPGVPGILPEDETILWRGQPSALGITFGALHGGLVVAYFAIVGLWRVTTAAGEGVPLGEALVSTWTLAVACGLALSILALVGWLTQRTTIYTITSHRVVMRYGIALPMTVNIPLKAISSANLRLTGGGTGDIALKLNQPLGLGYIHFWPHARAWRLSEPEPMFRAVRSVERVGQILAGAVRGAGIPSTAPSLSPERTPHHAGGATVAAA
ncbi:MAG: photosynthetic complex putative assembly protein PuhB [Hyphomicrobium sp.]|nr:photosynthetic complex putative assembly protein PuhB [Hyphomicrobium sp.]